MYETLKEASRHRYLPLPDYEGVDKYEDFIQAIYDLGYPEVPVVFKPQVGKGSRGVRIVHPKIDRLDFLINTKPTSKYITIDEVEATFRDADPFPPMMVMEFLDEPSLGQFTTDSLCYNGMELLTTVKTVERARWGVIQIGELVRRPDLVEQTKIILREIPLSFCVNLQFIGDRLMEINPRVSTFIYQEDLIAPYLSLKLAMDEVLKRDIMEYAKKIRYGLRFTRYFDQVFHEGGERVL
jgi:carbamoyl-phosphate synthase large subunit